MSNEDNGNLCTNSGSAGGSTGTGTGTGTTILLKPNSSSTEDLSEYTDADESISAPTEFLAEFLSAVMLKDYETALKYCKLILQYEPNNVTAKEFYPLILEKLQNTYNKATSGGDTNDDDGQEESFSGGDEDSSSRDGESSSASTSDSSAEEEEEVGEEEEEEGSGCDQGEKRCSSDGDATTASYSSLEDEEAEGDQLSNLAAKYRIDNVDLGNGNKIICDSAGSKWEVKSVNNTCTVAVPFGTSSDSESPTEPISQQTIAMLRAKVVPPRY